MNTNPDEATLALWLEDELTGAELAAVESWAGAHPEQLAAREDVRAWRAMISDALPAAEEPPYPDFFNSRIQQALRDSSREAVRALPQKKTSLGSWRAWVMPMTACAGMAVAFWMGKQSQAGPTYDVANAPRAILVAEPVVYTPETGVKAEWFSSRTASATVIVLQGISAIPDSTDFSNSAYLPGVRDIDSTAALGTDGNLLEAGEP